MIPIAGSFGAATAPRNGPTGSSFAARVLDSVSMGFAAVLASIALVLGAPAPPGGAVAAPGRDDTAALQAQLDAGGTVFLPRLPDGQCYATHGLWVSLDGTSIVSDGACIVALGPGPVRLHSPDGDPIAADAIFFTYTLVLTDFMGVSKTKAGLFLIPFAVGNFLGPLMLSAPGSRSSRRPCSAR